MRRNQNIKYQVVDHGHNKYINRKKKAQPDPVPARNNHPFLPQSKTMINANPLSSSTFPSLHQQIERRRLLSTAKLS